MELCREYDEFKKKVGEKLVSPLRLANPGRDKGIEKLKNALMHHIDRLWYESCLETIRTSDVYNSGAKKRVPRLYLINSYIEQTLGSLPDGESFRQTSDPKEMYEIVLRTNREVVVRNVEGKISRMKAGTKVKREGNLTRGPDGNAESKVALSTFPVANYVNHRTARVLDKEKGYIIAFVGDEQATPHFMRYSGLTGACINAMSINQFVKSAGDGIPFLDRLREYSEETNWSNGEVVQRGTGANYGLDGLVRPGFSYRTIVDFLHSKVIELQESGQDLELLLSHDWKVKIAASMVPRGLELNPDFCTSMRAHFRQAIFDKFMAGIMEDSRLDGLDLESTLRDLRQGTASQGRVDHYWTAMEKWPLGASVRHVFRDAHVAVASRLSEVCEQIIEFAASEFLNNKRISSELFNQPKPVDSVVDDFAVEAQNFANSLTMSAAFGAGALALRLADDKAAGLVSAVLGALNILIAFGTMTNVGRYKIRNEEARIIFRKEKFDDIKKAAFTLMQREDQDDVPRHLNTFVAALEEEVARFREDLRYYGYEEPVEFDACYSTLLERVNDPFEIRSFQLSITSKFVADNYQVNSYVQESLVRILKTLEQMYNGSEVMTLLSARNRMRTNSFFHRLLDFEPRLELSLQDGPVRWGFIKSRAFRHWDIVVLFRYLFSLIWCAGPRRTAFPRIPPIQVETLGIIKSAQQISSKAHKRILRREVRDLEQLYWATRESDVASLIFLTGAVVFVASILFTIARIFGIDILERVAFWALVPSSLGALLAVMHLARKLSILWSLWSTLGRRSVGHYDEARSMRTVRNVTMTQVLLTLVRLGAAGAATVALPYTVAEMAFRDSINTFSDLPSMLALAALLMAIAATFFFAIVEYVIRYNLPVDLGPFVCELFRDEIEQMYQDLQVRMSDLEPKQVQERETWEYVARDFLHRYRFDTVFAADRYGSILQYLQSGMDRGSSPDRGKSEAVTSHPSESFATA